MEWETFDNLVEQCAPWGTGLRFIGWGEPMMHPQFFRFLRRAADALLLTHVNTNGSKMDDTANKMLMGLGLNSIKFSFQGTDAQSYAEMRNIDGFENLFHKVRRLHMMRPAGQSPWIAISTTITDEHPSTVEVFKKRFEPICDQLSVGRTTFDFMDLSKARLSPEQTERLKDLAGRETVHKVHPDCPEVYDKLTVHYDGQVRICCNDVDGITDLGNVNDDRIEDIWMHSTIQGYREKLAVDGHDLLPLCEDCWDYMGTNKGKENVS
tara:strand:+ start:281 stop:1078 length:798 start_codon:yes stop_codon:yes gene_type:complete